MSDLSKRLRETSDRPFKEADRVYMRQAAYEIDALHEALKGATAIANTSGSLLKEKEAEIASLRAALEFQASAFDTYRETVKQVAAVREGLIVKLQARLASARKALEEIYTKDTHVSDGGKRHDLGPCAEIATAALFSFSDEQG